MGQNPMSEMEAKPSKEFENSETLFKSVDRGLTGEFMEFWETATLEFCKQFREAELDGSEDALRCRMIASMRLAQLGLSMFSFFSSCALSINAGKADSLACNATAKVVSMMVESKTDEWITKARSSLN